jgi:hypothetical protein
VLDPLTLTQPLISCQIRKSYKKLQRQSLKVVPLDGLVNLIIHVKDSILTD